MALSKISVLFFTSWLLVHNYHVVSSLRRTFRSQAAPPACSNLLASSKSQQPNISDVKFVKPTHNEQDKLTEDSPEFARVVRSSARQRTRIKLTAVESSASHSLLFIYVLKLEGDKYYVGKASDKSWARRVQKHFEGDGAAWTKLHKPIEVVEVREALSPFAEDAITKEYMEKYGIVNVRGGTYVQEVVDEEQARVLRRELRAATDKCTICGREGHWASDCYARTEIIEEGDPAYATATMNDDTIPIDADFSTKGSHSKGPQGAGDFSHYVCFRCNRPGHFASQCYAKTTAAKPPASTSSYYTSAGGNKINDGFLQYDYLDAFDDSENEVEPICYRCKRPGHYASQCYAKTVAGGASAATSAAASAAVGRAATSKTVVEQGKKGRPNPICYRCKRPGHYATQCFAKTIVEGGSSSRPPKGSGYR